MIRIKAPGRITLSGEHQDYLGFPVITLAISRYIFLEAKRIPEPFFKIELSDTNKNVEIPLNNEEQDYKIKRDYIRSCYNIFLRKGALFNKGYNIRIIGDIPVNAGVASSSALVIAWVYFLNLIGDLNLNFYQLAMEGYNAEVKEFQEGGGMMDHFNSIYGNLLYLEPINLNPKLKHLKLNFNGFVLGNSLNNKDTIEDLLRVKKDAITAFEDLKRLKPDFNQYSTKLSELTEIIPNLREKSKRMVVGNLNNRDITTNMWKLIMNNRSSLKKKRNVKKANLNFYQKLGELLNLHQQQLRENIRISTTKIDKLIESCLDLGAYGGKINGSGFGGTMFALMPGNERQLIQTIEDNGGEAFLIHPSNGVEIY
jgi:galactokinase